MRLRSNDMRAATLTSTILPIFRYGFVRRRYLYKRCVLYKIAGAAGCFSRIVNVREGARMSFRDLMLA